MEEEKTFWGKATDIFLGIGLVAALGFGYGGLIACGWMLCLEIQHAYRGHYPPPPAPLTSQELIDKAMAMKGAIVISPHRDLIEMGLATVTNNPENCDLSLKVGSPSIAAHAKHGWCVWELGNKYLLNAHGINDCPSAFINGNENTFIGSGAGYQTAFDLFAKCVGDKPDAR